MNRPILALVCALAVSSHLFSTPQYDYVGTPTTLGSKVSSLRWCGCDFWAAVGADAAQNGLIQLYGFDQSTLTYYTIGNPIINLGGDLFNGAWCTGCAFFAAVGNDADGDGLVQVYSFDPSHPENLELTATVTIAENVYAIDWCQGCNLMAIGGVGAFINSVFVQALSFDGTNLHLIGNMAHFNADNLLSLKWCPDCRHVIAVGFGPTFGTPYTGLIAIYSFDPAHPDTLALTYAQTIDGSIQTVDVCDDCQFVAIGGQTNTGPSEGYIDIFSFDPLSTPSLSLVASTNISSSDLGSIFGSLNWCGCSTLAVGGRIIGVGGVVQLYYFDGISTLSLQQTFTVGVDVNAVNWCEPCKFLIGGGVDALGPSANGIIQLFGQLQIGPEAPTNLTAQKACHRFPTQLDIINTICWDAVTGAVSYNVYADIDLTLLLASITNIPLCYTQHQICNGTSSTYYVTAVDANGNESESASVTV